MDALERIAKAWHEAEEESMPAYKTRTPWDKIVEKHRKAKIKAVRKLIQDGVIVDPGGLPT